MHRIWTQNFKEEKSFQEVVDFFNRIYPLLQGNKKKLFNIYHRAELASAGYPDGVLDDSEDEEEEEEEEDEQESNEEEEGEGDSSDGESSGESGSGGESDEDGSGSSSGESESNEGQKEESATVDSANDEVKLVSKPRRGRPPKVPSHELLSHSLLDHAKKVSPPAEVQIRSSNRKRSINRVKDDDDEEAASEVAQDQPLFCICRTIESENERYIACSVGHPDRCNGWVHLMCAGMSPTIPEETLQDIKDYICPLCAAELATDKKNKGRRSITEKLQSIEAFTSPVYNFSSEAPGKAPANNQRSSKSNSRRRSY